MRKTRAYQQVKFWQSLSTKATVLVATVSICVFIGLVGLTLNHQMLENRSLAERELRTTGFLTQATLNRIIRYGYPELIKEVIAELEVHRRVDRALIYDPYGRVVYSTMTTDQGRRLQRVVDDLPKPFLKSAGKYSELVFQPEQDRFLSKVPLTGAVDDNQTVQDWSLLIVYRHQESLFAIANQRLGTLLIELILVLVLASMLKLYLHRKLTLPLQRLQQGVEKLKDASTEIKIPLKDNDELGLMARAIETIARDRSAYFKDLQKLNTAIEQTNECVLITSIDGEIEYVNKAFIEVTGYSRAELIGQNPRVLQSGATMQTTYDQLWNRLKSGETWRGELLNKRKDGSNYVVWATITPVINEDGKITHFIGVEEDITERKADEEKLHFLAYYEPLTALPNRFHLSELMQQVLAGRQVEHYGALLLIDMDRLQHINDARGYEFGSDLIKAFAERLKLELKGREHTLAHLGADAFAVLLPENCTQRNHAKHKAEAIANLLLSTTENPFLVMNEEVKISISIGCAIYPDAKLTGDDETTAEKLIRSAETAMHKAKQQGGNSFRFYHSQFSQEVRQQFEMEKQLRQALSNEELRLQLQSQCLHSGKIISAEALIRWQHPEQGMISPAQFIPIAEQSDLIVAIDRWVLTQVCELLAELQQQRRRLTISVNISPRHFRKSDFEDWIDALVKETGIEHRSLVLEVTEGVLIDDVSNVVAKMDRLTNQGVQFAIDDFGTGYSSLAYLSRLPVHELKIDKSFIDAMFDPRVKNGVIQTIISVANHMNMRIVAEGVETQQQADFLYNADNAIIMQGYHYARPVDIATWRASIE
ncbi:EAL domain-containing protein [Idiomarina seosinensis]|uniref:Sensor domain-containing diguanylate cyclase n=1 Tax=Idiomarina seosinensis TaxID=281739 RepID=A0A432ZDD4_9GAMM|nr:EAL domain-containing protein [Idiomarina seosinensis]RUO75956.1 sensor domain-containing diguanylate cyclase [Idiomarina seosinensis]